MQSILVVFGFPSLEFSSQIPFMFEMPSLIELLRVGFMASLDLPLQLRAARRYVFVGNAEMPGELWSERRAVIGLNFLNGEGELLSDFLKEVDGSLGVVSIGIMVGSFRETVVSWMAQELPADLYLRPAGEPATDRHPTISLDVVDAIAKLPGVAAIDRLRAYEITYNGRPAMLGGADVSGYRTGSRSDFFSGRPSSDVFRELRGTLMDRQTLLRYLPDPAPSNLAVYVAPGTNVETVRSEIVHAVAGHRLLLFSDGEIRAQAIHIFDRTFAITYALEAVAVLVAVMGIAGALLGYFLSLVLIFVINKQSFGWTIRFHWPVAILLGGLTFVYAATVLSGLYPARIATQLNPIEVVHED